MVTPCFATLRIVKDRLGIHLVNFGVKDMCNCVPCCHEVRADAPFVASIVPFCLLMQYIIGLLSCPNMLPICVADWAHSEQLTLSLLSPIILAVDSPKTFRKAPKPCFRKEYATGGPHE